MNEPEPISEPAGPDNTTAIDVGSANRQLFTIVYFVLYIGLLIPLVLQIHRHRVIYQRKSNTGLSKLISILLCFLGLVLLRIVNAILFVWFLVAETIVVEAIFSFWLPYSIMNLEFGAITLVIMLWARVIKLSSLENDQWHFWLKIIFATTNVVLWVGTFVALGVVRPFGDSEFSLQPDIDEYIELDGLARNTKFRWIYMGLGLFSLMILVCGSIFIYLKVLQLTKSFGDEAAYEKTDYKDEFRKKTQAFLISNIIVFAIKIFLDWMVIFLTLNEELRRSMQFIWHTLPEMVLISVFLWIAWKPAETSSDSSTGPTGASGTPVQPTSAAVTSEVPSNQ